MMLLHCAPGPAIRSIRCPWNIPGTGFERRTMTTATQAAQAPRPLPGGARSRHHYRLVGGAGESALAAGLVNGAWYRCPVPRPVLKDLMKRADGRAIRDTLLWSALVIVAGALMWAVRDTGWFVAAFLLYAALYCGPAD